MNIITGYKGTPHITAQQDRDINMSTFGDGVYILNIGSKMSATIISANEVQVADGLIIAQGCCAEIARGTTESLTISNGSQDMYRTDLIVLRYTRNSGTGVETMALAVIEGTPASSSPATPAYTSGSIANEDTLVEFPLYKVNIDGITISSLTSMVSEQTIAKGSDVTTLTTSLNTLRNTVTSISTKIGSVAMGTTATTITGAIKELLTSINTLSTKIGSVSMGTSATTITGAIKELLTKINTNTTNISSATGRISSLDGKTQGISGTRQYIVNASGGKTYVALQSVSSYVVIVNSYSTSDSLRGMYLVGVTSSSALGITTVKSASSVALEDVDGGILRITNNGSVILRVTVITTSGTIPS